MPRSSTDPKVVEAGLASSLTRNEGSSRDSASYKPGISTSDLPASSKERVADPVPAEIPQSTQSATALQGPAPANSSVSEKLSYNRPEDWYWALYLEQAGQDDAALEASWDKNANGILVFTGLFAATVATFATQGGTQLLSQQSVDTSAALLAHLSQQLAGAANGTSIPALSLPPFETPRSAVRINILWYSSLLTSIICALLATVLQGWAGRYFEDARSSGSPSKRGRAHVLLNMAIRRWKLGGAVNAVVALLHISVVLFFIGLLDYLLQLNHTVGFTLIAIAALFASVYITLTIVPIFFFKAPYDTPATPMLRAAAIAIFWALSNIISKAWIPIPSSFELLEDIFSTLNKAMEDIRRYLPSTRLTQLSNQVRDTGIEMAGAKHSLGIVMKNIAENQELQFFYSNLPSFLQSEKMLSGSDILWYLETEYGMDLAIARLLWTCSTSSRNTDSAIVRAQRLQSLLGTITHEYFINSTFGHVGLIYTTLEVCTCLLDDEDPTISFLSYLLLADVGTHGFYAHIFPSSHGVISHHDSVKTSLANYIHCSWRILLLFSPENPQCPVYIYHTIWEPILKRLEMQVEDDIKNSFVPKFTPVISPILAKMLEDLDIQSSIYAILPNEPNASCKVDLTQKLRACPFIAESLRRIAKMHPTPLPHSPSSQEEIASEQGYGAVNVILGQDNQISNTKGAINTDIL